LGGCFAFEPPAPHRGRAAMAAAAAKSAAQEAEAQHTQRDVHTLNGLLKFFFFIVNSMYCLVGVALIGLSIYCLTDAWADLDPDIYRS
jgi:uncharacterized membrane protein